MWQMPTITGCRSLNWLSNHLDDVTDQIVGGPLLTIIIPVYNEEAILVRSVTALTEALEPLELDYELLICENGSTDSTAALARALMAEHPQIRLESLPEAGYGRALRHGIAEARGSLIAVFNIDFWDVAFLHQALELLQSCDLVVGSKAAPGSRDSRPFFRRLITRSFILSLRILFGFPGTDTHGIKAFRADRILPVIRSCQTNDEIFDTEIMLRAHRAGLRLCEIPVSVQEMRPSRYSLWRRVPSTFRDLVWLIRVLGIRGWGARRIPRAFRERDTV
jgi:glycosyltransferase involved in cell wall biosynthesis